MDRLPPHAPDAESAIIGCCLSFPKESLPDCQRVITADEFFYDYRNRVLWEIVNSDIPERCNAVMVMEKLRAKGLLDKIGLEYLSSCQDKAIGHSFLHGWLEEVLEKHISRKLISNCSRIISEVLEGGSITEILDRAERDILNIRARTEESKTIKELVRLALEKIELKCEKGNTITGLPTGLIDLDYKTDGLHGGEMIVIAAYPSVGKTALAVNIAVHNALNKTPVAIFSAEMGPVQLVVRSVCSESRVNFFKASYRDAGKLIGPSGRIANSPLHIEPASGFTIGQIAASARRLKQRHNIKIIVVDYIQRLSGKGDNREQEIAGISSGLKSLAMELDCCVIALSQLNDDGKLRESRAIGQDADSVWKLQNEGERQPQIQPVNLMIEKCRDGEVGKVNLTFLKTITRFECVSKISDEDVPHD